nr:aspartyl protease family protein [Scopulibacillus daqui]
MPIVALKIRIGHQSTLLSNVLLDTGCAASVFDTDELKKIGLPLDYTAGQAVRMYGIGGQSEWCYEQTIPSIFINMHEFKELKLQLGPIKSIYGFDGIIGNDIIMKIGMVIDFRQLKISGIPS